MDINATFIGQIIVFLIMLWFIAKVVVPMIADPINKRYAKIADGLAAADAGQKQLQAAGASAEQIVREARERAKLVDEQAQRRSTETIEAAKQAARAEGARLLAAADRRHRPWLNSPPAPVPTPAAHSPAPATPSCGSSGAHCWSAPRQRCTIPRCSR
jgi:hypothetical protein